ncbi:MAG: DUF6468 domain-containing protein [Alphaproteobacteria bacterium]|nr:DUF6468 domain-containing protein [Alphaproteobacteria bacterium]
MTVWVGLFLDAVLIGVVGVGIVQAVRLVRELRGLRASRVEMEKFVRDFNSAVLRAEEGVRGLRTAARESGDDLEKLVGKANLVRDELTFIMESADSVAERLSAKASKAMHSEPPAPQEAKPVTRSPAANAPQAKPRKEAVAPIIPITTDRTSLSRAEQELIQALKKLG